MTVSELIEKLEQYPKDLQVRTSYGDDLELSVWDEYYDGDSADPNCPVIRALVVT